MPSINKNFIDFCVNKYPNRNFEIFVETGTWKGETIFGVERFFNKLYTIEIKKELYETAKEIYAGNKITFINGDSSFEIAKLSKKLEGDTIFFLDGHWSKMDTGMGEKEIPLIEELEGIKKYFKHAAIIIIDDVRLFGCGPNLEGEKYHDVDWSYINEEKVLNSIKDRISLAYYMPSGCSEKDRIILNIRPLNDEEINNITDDDMPNLE
jgi:hypothetical protein